MRSCVYGNHWAQRQAEMAGLGFVPLDNAFAAVDDPAALQQICDRLGAQQIQDLLDKWLAILPNPFTSADTDAGYIYNLSILQAEFSLTQMLDTPDSGRVFFENVIRDNLDIGRPDQVSLIFDRQIKTRGRNGTPGRFRTRVITDGVTPSLAQLPAGPVQLGFVLCQRAGEVVEFLAQGHWYGVLELS